MPDASQPPALVASAVLGGIGLLCILVGGLVGVDGLFILGVVAGTLSLAAALYWRSQLIAEHRTREGPPSR